MIRILLVEDQEVVREGLKALLELKPDFEVVAEAGNGAQAIEQVERLQSQSTLPDVVLMDIRMPVMDGVTATERICQAFPSIKVLVFTTFNDAKSVAEALRVGAKGYLLKDTPAKELAEVIRSIHQGYTQFSPGVLENLLAQSSLTHLTQTAPPLPELPAGFKDLSPKERQVLALLAKGASNREIAQTLFVAEGTVRNHVSHILTRLDLRDRIQAAVVATPFIEWLDSET
jgi:DNA-binding NarL/FixJ family response regulator